MFSPDKGVRWEVPTLYFGLDAITLPVGEYAPGPGMLSACLWAVRPRIDQKGALSFIIISVKFCKLKNIY